MVKPLSSDIIKAPKGAGELIKTHEHEGIGFPEVEHEVRTKLARMVERRTETIDVIPRANRPILFLDFDDVLCLNDRFGGHDAIHALGKVQKGTAKLADFDELWRDLFSSECKKFLAEIETEFRPTYVISSSWALWMNRAAIAAVLRQTGLGFVADNLHSTWHTPRPDSPALTRAQEIALWHSLHPEANDQWVILDDEISGTGLKTSAFIVLCKGNQGITQAVYERLKAAFRLRLRSKRS